MYISLQAKDLITKLLDKDPSQRLGYKDPKGFMKHPFFDGLDWSKINDKTAESPYKKSVAKSFDENEKPQFEDYEDAILAFESAIAIFGYDDDTYVSRSNQKLFRNWEYVDKDMISIEQSIYQEMKEKHRKHKRKKSWIDSFIRRSKTKEIEDEDKDLEKDIDENDDDEIKSKENDV